MSGMRMSTNEAHGLSIRFRWILALVALTSLLAACGHPGGDSLARHQSPSPASDSVVLEGVEWHSEGAALPLDMAPGCGPDIFQARPAPLVTSTRFVTSSKSDEYIDVYSLRTSEGDGLLDVELFRQSAASCASSSLTTLVSLSESSEIAVAKTRVLGLAGTSHSVGQASSYLWTMAVNSPKGLRFAVTNLDNRSFVVALVTELSRGRV